MKNSKEKILIGGYPMAIHKKLEVGTILFEYHTSTYNRYGHRRNENHKYDISFNVLFVSNRRARTNGANVPHDMIPMLTKLGIRHKTYNSNRKWTTAIGCENRTYYRCMSSTPYPSEAEMEAAQRALEELFENGTSYTGQRLVKIEFMDDFKEKMSNKEALFSLLPPLDDFVAEESLL